jgi:hypothetical protein
MFKYLLLALLSVGCHSAELASLPATSYGSAQQNILSAPLSGETTVLSPQSYSQLAQLPPVGQALALPPKGDHQEVVVQHPQPRKILVRVVKPIIFEERIVIVPYRRVTHEVRPVIEERHTVIYGKDGKEISAPASFKPVIAQPTALVNDGYNGGPQLTRTVAEPTYAQPIVRKVGQTISKRTALEYTRRAEKLQQQQQQQQQHQPQRESFLRKLNAEKKRA